MMRIGQGFDVHKLVPGRELILCGVKIPYELGLEGHSDADVAAHAITEAWLGALALGDLGHIFPDTDAAYRNADSMKLLDTVLHRNESKIWKLGNLDLTIVAQEPKMAPYILEMRRNLTAIFGCDYNRISVKATTTEKLGFTGRGEGIAATAVILLTEKIPDSQL